MAKLGDSFLEITQLANFITYTGLIQSERLFALSFTPMYNYRVAS